MRIAGINSPNYHIKQPNNPQSAPSQGQNAAIDQSNLPQHAGSGAVTTNNVTQQSPKSVSQQNGTLMQPPPSAKDLTQETHPSNERIEYYRRNKPLPTGAWYAYASGGDSVASPVPDNSARKAQAAIYEYLQTQHIEERLHFEAVLGVDEYA